MPSFGKMVARGLKKIASAGTKTTYSDLVGTKALKIELDPQPFPLNGEKPTGASYLATTPSRPPRGYITLQHEGKHLFVKNEIAEKFAAQQGSRLKRID